MITIRRDSGYADYLRAYEVVLDGNVIGKIKNGQELELNVPSGQHELYLKIDWCRSNGVAFENNGSNVVFECGSSLRGLRILLAILYITFFYDKYIWLKKK